jgi:UDPglucose 6-dehydrogenase
MKVCAIGTGYVGLVTGVCLSEIGHDVICVDNVESKIQKLQKGICPIFEPGLEYFLKKNMRSGRLRFTSDIKHGVETSEIIFISVGTPSQSNGQPDLSHVEAVASDIGKYINADKVIVNKSTVPIGSGDWVSMIVSESIENNNGNKICRFSVVSNPEFMREGSAVNDTFFPDRIVIGSASTKAIKLMLKLYRPLIEQSFEWPSHLPRLFAKDRKIPVVTTDLTSAEMIKYAANSFLAAKISFINEIANICEKVGSDVFMVSEGIGLDSRIGRKFLNAGIGWGGSCFRKDVAALICIANEYGMTPQLLNAVMNVNSEQRLKVIKKVQDELKIIKGKTIAVLGIAYKPNTDDTRDAPAISIMNSLANLGAKIRAYDPVVKERPITLSEKVKICPDLYEATKDADLMILATEWDEFMKLDFERVKKAMAHCIVIDGRNVFDKTKLGKMGFRYIGIGR